MNYKKYIAIKVSSYLNLSIEKIENSIVTPSDIKNGDYSLLCFKLNEKLNKSPSEVSSYLKLKLNDTIFEKIEVNGAYLNFFIDKYTYTKNVLRKIINNENKCIEFYNKEKYICIENSFINKNEKFNLNNYFQIIVSNIFCNLFTEMGYNVVDINSTKILWEDFYKLLIIGFDNEIKKKLNLQKEKNFNNINLLNDLKEKNLITTINEVDIIDLEKYNMPPYIIANKNKINKNLMDLSFIIQSKAKYNFYKYIYISGKNEITKFSQFKKIIELLGCEWGSQYINIKTGLIKFAKSEVFIRDEKYVSFSNLISETIDEIKNEWKGKNINLKDNEDLLKNILLSGIIFSFLINYRENNIGIDFSKDFSLEKKSGPYVIYSYIKTANINYEECNYNKFNFQKDFKLIKLLDNYKKNIKKAVEEMDPSIIIRYIIDLAEVLDNLHKQICINNDENLEYNMVLIKVVRTLIKDSLKLIGIELI